MWNVKLYAGPVYMLVKVETFNKLEDARKYADSKRPNFFVEISKGESK